MARKTTLKFGTFYNGCKFFYQKGSEVEVGVIHQTTSGVSAALFLGEQGAWTEEIPVGDFSYTKDAQDYLRSLFADKQKLVDVIETYRASQMQKLDALTQRLF